MKLSQLIENQNILGALTNKLSNGEFELVEDLEKFLMSSGMAKNTSGMNSVVYENKKENFVVKISNEIMPRDYFWKYITIPHDSNPMFPVIHRSGVIMGRNFCIMEYLNLKPHELDELALEMGYPRFSSIMKVFYMSDDPRVTSMVNNIPALKGRDHNYIKNNVIHVVSREFRIDLKQLDDFFNKVERKFGKSGIEGIQTWFDIHSKNVGFRTNGQIVMFDPVGSNMV